MHAVAHAYTVETQTIFTLPRSLRTLAVARACRVALLAFANGAPRWGKHELAAWLAGPYAEITRTSAPLVAGMSRRVLPEGSQVDSVQLALVMKDAIAYARDLLRASMHPEGGAVSAWDAWRRGLVARCEDEMLNEGWIPLDVPGARLRERLLSLWATDYLSAAEEYESYLGVCEVCEVATFDPLLRIHARCKDHNARQVAVSWPHAGESAYSSVSHSERDDPNGPRSGIHRRVLRSR
jgi:hypothetical protein